MGTLQGGELILMSRDGRTRPLQGDYIDGEFGVSPSPPGVNRGLSTLIPDVFDQVAPSGAIGRGSCQPTLVTVASVRPRW